MGRTAKQDAQTGSLSPRELSPGSLSSGAHGQPPRLQLHIGKRIKMLLLINCIPICISLMIAWSYYQGNIQFTPFSSSQEQAAVLALISCAIVMVSWWIILPTATWVRNYPRWHYHRYTRIVWIVPYICGTCVWAVLWLLCTGAAILSCIGIIGTLYVLFTS